MALDQRRPILGGAVNPTEAQAEATRNGSPSTRPTARGTGSNTRHATASSCSGTGVAIPALHRRRGHLAGVLSLFLTFGRRMERSTWTPTAIFLSVAGAGGYSTFHLRSLEQRADRDIRHRLSTEATYGQPGWHASISGGINPAGLDGQVVPGRLIAPVGRLTTTFTCCAQRAAVRAIARNRRDVRAQHQTAA